MVIRPKLAYHLTTDFTIILFKFMFLQIVIFLAVQTEIHAADSCFTLHCTRQVRWGIDTSSYWEPWRHALWLASRWRNIYQAPIFSPWFSCPVLWRQHRGNCCISDVRLSSAGGSKRTSCSPTNVSHSRNHV